jgi:hypothetical protein
LDAYAEGFTGEGGLEIRTGEHVALKINVNLSWGANCGPTTLWFFIPQTKDLVPAFDAISVAYLQALEALDMQRLLPTKAGCAEAPASLPSDRFSGKLFIYSETKLDPQATSKLEETLAAKGVTLTVRGAAYLEAQRIRRTVKPPSEVVVMMIGGEARHWRLG